MLIRLSTALAALGVIAGCSPAPDERAANQTAASAPAANAPASAPLAPAAPGEPGGLADDRSPIPEGPIDERSAQGAAQVVQTFFALIEQRRYGEAWRLWADGGRASGLSAEAFAAGFDPYAEYHAEIGAPARLEGAAGSLYVDVPMQAYGSGAGASPRAACSRGPARAGRRRSSADRSRTRRSDYQP
jgi:hypothetical protein